MKLRDLVQNSAETMSPASTLRDAAQAMVAGDVGSMGIVDDGALIGILTERDILEATALGVDFDQAVIGNHMTRNPDVFSPNTDVDQVAEWLLETGYRHVPVIDEDTSAILSIRDILAAIVDPGRMRVLNP